jgi:hypothetical protein
MSGAAIDRLTPGSDNYPSALSSDDDDQPSRRLHHSYPGLTTEAATYPKTNTFTADKAGPAPSFIHAGWDSSSDISDL